MIRPSRPRKKAWRRLEAVALSSILRAEPGSPAATPGFGAPSATPRFQSSGSCPSRATLARSGACPSQGLRGNFEYCGALSVAASGLIGRAAAADAREAREREGVCRGGRLRRGGAGGLLGVVGVDDLLRRQGRGALFVGAETQPR